MSLQQLGCAVLECPAIKYQVVHGGPVYDEVGRQRAPAHILKECLELLNMDAHEALEQLARTTIG
jgi:hypothetical protein